jgi:hypothetical protein
MCASSHIGECPHHPHPHHRQATLQHQQALHSFSGSVLQNPKTKRKKKEVQFFKF